MIYSTRHAVQRYQERVKEQLGDTQARQELEALAALGTRLPAKPDWISERSSPCAYWLELTEDLVAPVLGDRIVTVIARVGISKPHRAKKKARKREVRAKQIWRNGMTRPGQHRRGGREVEWS